MYILGDIGGTKTRIGFSDDLRRIKKIKVVETFKNYKDFLKFLEKLSYRLHKIKRGCFCFAGTFDKNKEKLIFAPNLKDYENKNLKKDLEKIFKTRIILENDAIMAGIGEALWGKGKNFKIFGYITIGSGIGGAKIIRLNPTKAIPEKNTFGFEPGHSLIFLSNPKEIFPLQIEELIGGKSIEKIFREKPEMIKSKKIWQGVEKIFSIFLVNISLFWSVDTLIVGGGISKKLNFKNLKSLVFKFHPLNLKIKILRAKLGEFAGLYGGLSLCKSR